MKTFTLEQENLIWSWKDAPENVCKGPTECGGGGGVCSPAFCIKPCDEVKEEAGEQIECRS